jgi:hypothetical protein
MDSLAILSFSIQPFEGSHVITPYVNGTSLVVVVSAFERDQCFDPVGGYGGLIPNRFNCGPLDRYFLGDFEPNSYFAKIGGVYLLGCDCGEVGCWPLSAHIETEGESGKWTTFQQPHRSQRDYSAFGPFIFDADLYRRTVAALRDKFSQVARD